MSDTKISLEESNRVRKYIKYYETLNSKVLDISSFCCYTLSWSREKGTEVPAYFKIEYLNSLMTDEKRAIPAFVIKWLAFYFNTTPDRMTEFSPENEIKCIYEERKIAAAQAKAAESKLMEMWRNIPDYRKSDAIKCTAGMLKIFIKGPDPIETLHKMSTGHVVMFPIFKKGNAAYVRTEG